jgi:hypothetical protein
MRSLKDICSIKEGLYLVYIVYNRQRNYVALVLILITTDSILMKRSSDKILQLLD